jgi:hypothetical protein
MYYLLWNTVHETSFTPSFTSNFYYKFLLQIITSYVYYTFLLQIFNSNFYVKFLLQIFTSNFYYKFLLQIFATNFYFKFFIQIFTTNFFFLKSFFLMMQFCSTVLENCPSSSCYIYNRVRGLFSSNVKN